MQRVTFKLEESALEEIDDEADDDDVSRSQHLRNIIHSRHEAERLRDELEDLRDEYEGKLQEARNRAKALNRENEQVDELAKFAEREQSIQVKREIREDKRSEAGLLTRASWWLTGGPTVSDEELEDHR